MIQRHLQIGRWQVEFYFAPDGYDKDALIDRLFDLGAGARIMRRAGDLMEGQPRNTGFTFTNPEDHVALVAIGPTTNGQEFINTLTHEAYHLAVAIAADLGVDLESEAPAYIVGDSLRELASVVCDLGCSHCH